MSDNNSQQIKVISDWLGHGSINIFGVQFSGKDTQAEILAKVLNANHFGGGDIIRNSDRTDVINVVDKGNLAPTDAYREMVLPYFSKEEFTNKPLILSSVGRWIGEEEPVFEAAKKSGHAIKAAVLIEIPESEIWKRWEIIQKQDDRGARVDDSREGLEKRLQEFKEKTLPVLKVYDKNGLLITVNGEQSRENVTNEIIEKLSELAS